MRKNFKKILFFILTIGMVVALSTENKIVYAETIYTVTNTNDSGVGSLRWAITQAGIKKSSSNNWSN